MYIMKLKHGLVCLCILYVQIIYEHLLNINRWKHLPVSYIACVLVVTICSQSYLYLNEWFECIDNKKSCLLPSLSKHTAMVLVYDNLFKFSAATSSCLCLYFYVHIEYAWFAFTFFFKALSVYFVTYNLKIDVVNMCNKSNVILISVNLICI